MGVEILGAASKLVEPNEGNASFPTEMDIKSLPSPGQKLDEPTKTGMADNLKETNGKAKEADNLASSQIPKDAVDEWPAEKKVHNFYFMRVRSYEDPELKTKIEKADKDLVKMNRDRFQIIDKLKEKRSERSNLKSQLQPFLAENKKYRTAMEETMKEMKPLQKDLAEHRTAKNAVRERGTGLCSSEEELDDLIRSLHYRIQHESNTLNEEKQLLKEIKQLEATRERVIANMAAKTKIESAKGQAAELQDKMKLLGGNMDEVRKEKQAVIAQIKQLDEKLKVIDDDIALLEEQLRSVTERRDKAYETLNKLRKARDEVNACFYQNRSLLNCARELAVKKDIEGLEALYNSEVGKFMLLWSSNKAFRDDYERRILTSLDNRQLSRDGRLRNPDEKLIVVEKPSVVKLETSPPKIASKQGKEAITVTSSEDTVSSKGTQAQELTKPAKAEAGRKNSSIEEIGRDDEYGQSQERPKPKEIDTAKLKEMKREEEIAKAKLAMDRKKKLAEKAAAKAAIRAQKEAEKKLKQKEKKAKKKAGITEADTSAEQSETEEKAEEPEEENVKLDNPVLVTSKEQKANVKYRSRPKVQTQLPRAILKRKKSHSYMYWAVPAAILALVLAIVAGYYSFGRVRS